MGGFGIPGYSPDALWEANIWVLIIAIFAYDIRYSLYAVKGLAVGVMFESMCIGQILVRVLVFTEEPWLSVISIILISVYFVATLWQFAHPNKPLAKTAVVSYPTAIDPMRQRQDFHESMPSPEEAKPEPDYAVHNLSKNEPLDGQRAQKTLSFSDLNDVRLPSDLMRYCQNLAAEYQLTPREAEILEFLALGRSAKYISDELLISYNTARTHIKHVYEKLNIHSKQELIDTVLYGAGLM